MTNVLWIEDQANTDLPELFSVAVAAGHLVTVVGNASDVIRTVLAKEFDVVIVDVRIDPGDMPAWYNYFHQQCTSQGYVARLGMQVLRTLWNVKPAVVMENAKAPDWLTRDRVGILSVEPLDGDLKDDLDELGIDENHYICKSGAGDRRGLLRELVERIDVHQLPHRAVNNE